MIIDIKNNLDARTSGLLHLKNPKTHPLPPFVPKKKKTAQNPLYNPFPDTLLHQKFNVDYFRFFARGRTFVK